MICELNCRSNNSTKSIALVKTILAATSKRTLRICSLQLREDQITDNQELISLPSTPADGASNLWSSRHGMCHGLGICNVRMYKNVIGWIYATILMLHVLESYNCSLLRMIKNPSEIIRVASGTKFGVFRSFYIFWLLIGSSLCFLPSEGRRRVNTMSWKWRTIKKLKTDDLMRSNWCIRHKSVVQLYARKTHLVWSHAM